MTLPCSKNARLTEKEGNVNLLLDIKFTSYKYCITSCLSDDRKTKKDMLYTYTTYIHVNTHTNTHTHIYIYIYIHTYIDR